MPRALEKCNLFVDVDFIPPEFEGTVSATIKIEEWNLFKVKAIISTYKNRCLFNLFCDSVKEEKVSAMLEKMKSNNPDLIQHLFDYSLRHDRFELIKILYDACVAESDKQTVGNELALRFGELVLASRFERAKECLKALPKEIILPFIKNYSQVNSFFDSSIFHHFAENLLEEKFNFNKKNETGKTLLHMTAMWSQPFLIAEMLKLGADPNVQDNDGYTPLLYAAKA